MQVRAALAIAIVLVVGLGAAPAAADDGDLDPSFEVPTSRSSYTTTVLLPDGGVVTVAQEPPGAWERAPVAWDVR